MKRYKLMPMGFALVLGMAPLSGAQAQALAAGAEVAAEGETRTEACGGGAATVSGNRNAVTFTGVCRSLTVRGEGNKISIGLVSGADVDVQGGGNQIRLVAGRPGRLLVSGSNTALLLSGGTAPSADQATLSGDGQNLPLHCGGQAVTLDSNRSRFLLSGGCRSVAVRGKANRVEAELVPGADVRIEGDGTVVTYRLKGSGKAPVATILGVGSLLEADSTVAQAPAPAAPPAGITRVVTLVHDLQAVNTLDGTLVRVPGADFAGAAGAPDGAAALGGVAELIGRIRPSAVRIVGGDPGDAGLAGQRAASVQTWLAGSGGVKLPMQVAAGHGDTTDVEVTILR